MDQWMLGALTQSGRFLFSDIDVWESGFQKPIQNRLGNTRQIDLLDYVQIMDN